jgi:hypothetical protein
MYMHGGQAVCEQAMVGQKGVPMAAIIVVSPRIFLRWCSSMVWLVSVKQLQHADWASRAPTLVTAALPRRQLLVR